LASISEPQVHHLSEKINKLELIFYLFI